jgi:outer membrane lipoprotein-sorting protein
MNCSECRDDFAAYQEGLLDTEAQSRTTAHLAECPACQAEFDQMRSLVVHLTRARPGAPGISLETQVMDRIIHEQALTIRRLQMRKRIRLLGVSGALTAAIALLIIAGVQMTQPDNRIQAAEVLAQGAKASTNISSVHILGKIRTSPHDNFSYINPHQDFFPIEVWKQFGEKTKWRVEKPERVAVMDGDSTIMWMKPANEVDKIPYPTEGAYDTGWLLSLANVKDLIDEALKSALAKGWDLKLTHEEIGGANKLLVNIEAKAEKYDNPDLKNNYVDTSDTRRIYRFDAATKRLESIKIYMREKDKEELIFETDNIDYDRPIDNAIFSLKLPQDVVWLKEPGDLPEDAKSFIATYTKNMPKISNIHIQGKMRTPPRDNFSAINPDGDFVPMELWKQFGEKPKWRIDKPGRLIVMDGDTTVMLLKPNLAVKFPFVTNGAFDTRWMVDFTSVQDLVWRMRNELEAGADLKIAKEDVNGARKLLVTMTAKARLIKGKEYLKDTFIDDADTRQVFRFDAATKRLESVSIYLSGKDKDVLIFETNDIEYDKPIDPAVFSLKLPEDVEWYKEPPKPGKLPDNEKYEKMTPKEATAAFLEACSKENWGEAENFYSDAAYKIMRTELGGLQKISIGEPYQEKNYPGWLVPYEIKLKKGEVQKSKLRLNNDNPGKRYVVEGGI